MMKAILNGNTCEFSQFIQPTSDLICKYCSFKEKLVKFEVDRIFCILVVTRFDCRLKAPDKILIVFNQIFIFF